MKHKKRITRLALFLGLPLRLAAGEVYNQVVNVLPPAIAPVQVQQAPVAPAAPAATPVPPPAPEAPELPPSSKLVRPYWADDREWKEMLKQEWKEERRANRELASVKQEADPTEDPHQRGLSLGGPRFGVSYVSGPGFDKLKELAHKAKPDIELEPGMTQFGWQVEYRMFRTSSGITALTEFIPLVGGLDLGLALPTATWLVGLRGKKGFEVGVGPNFGMDGVAMMAGAGYTFDLGGINVPLNFAVGKGAKQTNSFALSTGFNL